MQTQITLDTTYVPSEDVVYRDVEGELIIVPLTREVVEGEEDAAAIFTLNECGRAIWDLLDGQRSLKDLVAELSIEFDAPPGKIETDVLGLVGELVKRKMLVEAT